MAGDSLELQLDKLAPALVALQQDLTAVGKSADNPFFKSKYAPHPEVRKTLQPLLAKHKLALIDVPHIVENQNGLRFMLIHTSGQYIEGIWKLTPVKNDPQGEGSDVTYKRRYGEMAMTGLVADEDDDGNSASTSKPAAAKSSASSPAASPNRVPSQKQLDLINNLAVQKGKSDEWLKELGPKIKTSADASGVIEKLQALEDA